LDFIAAALVTLQATFSSGSSGSSSVSVERQGGIGASATPGGGGALVESSGMGLVPLAALPLLESDPRFGLEAAEVSETDVVGSLLLGIRPTDSLLPQKGSTIAPVATVAGEFAEPDFEATPADLDEDDWRSTFVIGLDDTVDRRPPEGRGRRPVPCLDAEPTDPLDTPNFPVIAPWLSGQPRGADRTRTPNGPPVHLDPPALDGPPAADAPTTLGAAPPQDPEHQRRPHGLAASLAAVLVAWGIWRRGRPGGSGRHARREPNL
jgi:hypothetical protein